MLDWRVDGSRPLDGTQTDDTGKSCNLHALDPQEPVFEGLKSTDYVIVMEDEIGDLADKGLNAAFIGRYYNPGSVAREAKLLQRGGDDAPWPGLPHGRLVMPTDEVLEAWRRAVSNPASDGALDDDVFERGHPGLSDELLELIREYRPSCIRAYAPRYSGWLAVELARALGVPALVSVHSTRRLAAAALKEGKRGDGRW